MESHKLFFVMEIVDGAGRVHAKIRQEIHEDAASISERFVDDMRAGPAIGFALVSFEETVRVLKRKQFRRGLLQSAAAQCGMALADFMEDKEGWYGLDRQESAHWRTV